MLSLLLNGAPYTLGYALFVTLLRYAIALPIGFYTGVTGKGRTALSTVQLIVSSVPALLFLFGQLAVLRIFVGGGEEFVFESGTGKTPGSSIFLTRVGEWGCMIASGTTCLRQAPWILLSSGAIFTCAILVLLFYSK